MEKKLTKNQIFFLNGYCHFFAQNAYYAIYEDEDYREKEGLPFTHRRLITCMGLYEDVDTYDEETDEYDISVEHVWLKDEISGLCFDAKGWRTEDELLADYPYLQCDGGWILADEKDRQLNKEIADLIGLGILKKIDDADGKIYEKFMKVYKKVEVH